MQAVAHGKSGSICEFVQTAAFWTLSLDTGRMIGVTYTLPQRGGLDQPGTHSPEPNWHGGVENVGLPTNLLCADCKHSSSRYALALKRA